MRSAEGIHCQLPTAYCAWVLVERPLRVGGCNEPKHGEGALPSAESGSAAHRHGQANACTPEGDRLSGSRAHDGAKVEAGRGIKDLAVFRLDPEDWGVLHPTTTIACGSTFRYSASQWDDGQVRAYRWESFRFGREPINLVTRFLAPVCRARIYTSLNKV